MNAEENTDPEVVYIRWELLRDFARFGSCMLGSLDRALSQSPLDRANDRPLSDLNTYIFEFVNWGCDLTYNGPADEFHRRRLGPAYTDDPAGWLGPLCDRIYDVIHRLAPWRCGLERENLVLFDDEFRGEIESVIHDCREKASSFLRVLETPRQSSDRNEDISGPRQDERAEE
jgi:hypothetical protein